MMLACSGGLLDAIVYPGHGHVFVTAMTGNLVLMGIAVIGRDWGQVLRQADVIGGFLLGLFASELIRERPPHLASRITLTLEIMAIGLVGFFVARLPMLLLLAILSFVSALQIATFRRVGPFRYNSTFVTGNLRDFVEAFFERRAAPEPAARTRASQKTLDLGFICVAFLVGVLFGAWLGPLFPRRGLWFAEVPLLVVMGISLLNRSQT